DFDSAALDEHVRSNEVEDINAFEGRRTTSNSVPLLPKLMEWACNDEAKNRVYAILGSFGAGKTTAAQLLAKELVKLGESDESAPFPVYLDFRRLQGKGDAVFSADANLGTIIAHCMDPFSAGKLDVENVIAYLRNKRCVLIFDGLDEIGTLVGIERATNLYRQLLQIIEGNIRSADARENAAQWALSPLRILITCRTHFFRDHIAEAAALNDYDRSGTLAGRKDNNVFKSLYMAPFTPEQIDNFFIRTLGEEAGQDAVNTIRRIHDLEGLASKPVMTRYIADLVPDLESDHEVGRTINAATIYGHLFRRAMERDGGKAQRMSIADREDLLEAFALFLWQSRTVQTNCKTLENWFDAYVENVPGLRLAFQVADGRSGLHTELRNTSFLIREADENFRFSHTSFYEYFLARGLTNALNQQAFDRFENTPEISRETLDFLVDLAETKKDVGALLRGIDKVLTGDASVERRQMALKILNHCLRRNIRHNLPDYADLSALDLKDSRIATGHLVRLQNIRFTAADFSGTWFSRLHFRNCDFDRTNLAQSSFDQCTFEACTGTPRGLASACARLSPGVTKLPFKVQPILSFRQENSHGSKKGIPATMDKGHEDRLTSVAFAPDGRTVLTGSDDKTCRLWGVSSGKTIMIFKGHEHEVTSVAFAPDGRTVLTGSDDKTCRLWDVSSGKTIMIFKGHEHEVTSVAFAPDGHTVLTGSYDNVARLWDVASGETVMAFKGHKGVVTSVAFALDGHTVLTGSHDHTARLWDVASGKALMTFGGHEQEVTSVAFAPDGVTVLTGSYDCTARLWDVASGKTIIIFKHHEFGVASVAFAPDGHAVLTGSFDNTARLWDSASGKTLMIFKGHDYGVTGVGFAPDGRTLLTGSDDHTARLWDVASSDTVITLKGHDNWLASIALAPDGGTVLTGSCDNTVRLWNVASGETIMTFEGHEDEVSCVAFAPNGRTVLT
ncbi:MAG: NACHT domain-containing protein, partial [Oceanococcus sp.]